MSAEDRPTGAAPRPDRELGMDSGITRRDFLGGVSVAIASGVLPGSAGASSPRADVPSSTAAPAYPPSLTGSRGSHPGSFEVAHQMAFGKRTDWGPATDPDGVVYDLIVVGAGVSGLSAAYFYREQYPKAKILLLDNHDDFGGHAKRNEFKIGDRTLLGHGGSQTLESPSDYSDDAKGLLASLGVEPRRFYDYYDGDFYRNHGLSSGLYFDQASYGEDKLVMGELRPTSKFLRLAKPKNPIQQTIGEMPVSDEAKRQLLSLMTMNEDRLPNASIFREPELLSKISYLDFLKDHLGIRNPQVIDILHHMPDGYGIDVVSAMYCLSIGLPGTGGTSMRWLEGLATRLAMWSGEPYIFHFPDGNASIARLLVRAMIPNAASGSSMEDIVTAKFDYAQLDPSRDTGDPLVRLRLNSTVVHVANEGASESASGVSVTYVRGGRSYRARAKGCVLACYNMAIPYLCPDLPAKQSRALAQLVKIPLTYTNVLLRNWKAWKELGLGVAYCPGSRHSTVLLDFPVSMGEYQYSQSPEEPIIALMIEEPRTLGLPLKEQLRRGQAEMLATSFESIERDTRTQLAGMLGPAGFDPRKDIAAITVNRWPHGYAYEYNELYDTDDEESDWVVGRQRFGRIAIANSDAGARAYIDCAIDQARRAVNELG